VADDGEVFEVERGEEVVEVCGEAGDAVAEGGLVRVAVSAHVESGDAEAGGGEVAGLFAPFDGGLAPAGDEEEGGT